ncbi:4'-phosphopantetheinyl transferase superfamily protein [Chryseobacterium sp. B21-037]|uniref:4'-phosphopantetheinyl transferase family protein n=1 Tax=Chryseobacterium sp. B21-037 TaxID=2926038 RepID=UPI00235818F0|nr:4'-phosphopantetheinyl transferase superfamily protein [Chryseobacterium sp. B21-037]MDC8104856.1 4'-phosphopantetheinyl transferase superfamily protein [Chryseobacterium sp. B21-037]
MDALPYYKPYIKNHNLHFNISHAGNLVICCINESPVGIDVEYINQEADYEEFKFQMTSGELEKIHFSEDKVQSFFTYWTEKEAVIKAHGKGMFIPLDSFEVNHGQAIIENEIFYLKEIYLDKKYQCCIAANEDIREKTIFVKRLNVNFL